MKTENAILMKMARESLKGKWGISIGTVLIYFIITLVIQKTLGRAGDVASMILTGPFALGLSIFFLAIARNQEAKVEKLFEGFNVFATALVAYLLQLVFTLLWMLLLIIPGIVAAYSYSMIFYIIADDRSIGAMDALRKSNKKMYGYKWKLFYLHLRFFGWALLSILTLGIGFLWLVPYMQVAIAKFYDDIKGGEEMLTTEQSATVE